MQIQCVLLSSTAPNLFGDASEPKKNKLRSVITEIGLHLFIDMAEMKSIRQMGNEF